MPTFVFVKEGTIVDKIVGARKDDLPKKIEQHKWSVPSFNIYQFGLVMFKYFRLSMLVSLQITDVGILVAFQDPDITLLGMIWCG